MDLTEGPTKEAPAQQTDDFPMHSEDIQKYILVNGTLMVLMSLPVMDKRSYRGTVKINGTYFQKFVPWSQTARQDITINGVILERPTEIPDKNETIWINDEVYLLPKNLGPIKTVEMPKHPKMQYEITVMDQLQKKLLLLEQDRQFPQYRQSKEGIEADLLNPIEHADEGEQRPAQKRPNEDGQGGEHTPSQKKVKPIEIIDLTHSPGKERPPRRRTSPRTSNNQTEPEEDKNQDQRSGPKFTPTRSRAGRPSPILMKRLRHTAKRDQQAKRNLTENLSQENPKEPVTIRLKRVSTDKDGEYAIISPNKKTSGSIREENRRLTRNLLIKLATQQMLASRPGLPEWEHARSVLQNRLQERNDESNLGPADACAHSQKALEAAAVTQSLKTVMRNTISAKPQDTIQNSVTKPTEMDTDNEPSGGEVARDLSGKELSLLQQKEELRQKTKFTRRAVRRTSEAMNKAQCILSLTEVDSPEHDTALEVYRNERNHLQQLKLRQHADMVAAFRYTILPEEMEDLLQDHQDTNQHSSDSDKSDLKKVMELNPDHTKQTLEAYQKKYFDKHQHIDIMVKAQQLMRITDKDSTTYKDADETYHRHKALLRQKLHNQTIGDFKHKVCTRDVQDLENIASISKNNRPNTPTKPLGHNITQNVQAATGGPDDTYYRSPEDNIAEQE